MIKVNGPKSEIEAEALKKLISEKELKQILSSPEDKDSLRRAKVRLLDLISFYDRIIKSINVTITSVDKNKGLDNSFKKNTYLVKQEKDLYKAKSERLKFRKYLADINSLI